MGERDRKSPPTPPPSLSHTPGPRPLKTNSGSTAWRWWERARGFVHVGERACVTEGFSMNHFVSSGAAPAPQPPKAARATRSFKSCRFPFTSIISVRAAATAGAAGGRASGRGLFP